MSVTEALSYEEILRRKGKLLCSTYGSSMRPLLRSKLDAVLVVRNQGLPRRGDVVLYKRVAGEYALHRVVAVEGNHLSLRGDNQYALEAGIDADQVLGVARYFYKNKRSFSDSNGWYRCYVLLWTALYPFRRVSHRIHSRLHGGQSGR